MNKQASRSKALVRLKRYLPLYLMLAPVILYYLIFMDESLDSFITGKTSLDQFDAFVEQMNKMGLQDILKIYNDAYARYQATE